MNEDDLWELEHEPWMVAARRSGYDHITWAIVNDEPICKGMGAIAQPRGAFDGMIYLLGRASDGRHYHLKGPFTKEQFAALRATGRDSTGEGR